MPPVVALAIFAVLVLLLAGGAIWSKKFGGYMPEPYKCRHCQGSIWKKSFPETDKNEIRRFLRIFAESFAFRESQKLQVSPEDRVLSVYRAMHPKSGGIDALELETFATKIEREYKIVFAKVWNEKLTLGQLFKHCQSRVFASTPSEA